MLTSYQAFGLTIASEVPLPLPMDISSRQADVWVRKKSLTFQAPMQGVQLDVPQVCRFLIPDGSTILLDPAPDASTELVALYVLGSCMGAVLYRRGALLLHGSCVEKDGKALLITGESGAGKSTLAREFLKRGWRLVTDDVASICLKNQRYCVQSSYPSQKLWRDAMDRYALSGQSLMQEGRMEKYAVDASAHFASGLSPLFAIVRLCLGDESALHPVEGIARVDQIMRNLYRPQMIPKDKREQYFQRCVDIGDEIPFFIATRTTQPNGTQMLCSLMEEYFS